MNELCRKYSNILDIPAFIFTLSDEYITNNSNGCGSEYNEIIIADSILGVNICPACRIHDLEYGKGGTKKDKYNADRLFRKNMTILIKKRKEKLLNKLKWWQWVSIFGVRKVYNGRLEIVKVYYFMVRKFGNGSFNFKN